MRLPEKFAKRMEALLGEEYENFLRCYDSGRKQGLRVNTAKISVEEFLKITPFALTPIPWVENGFFYREEDRVTKHPHYYCGLYYIQEPSAMVPASRLPVEPGDQVLDLCAAPGGKATELGARLGGTGVLVANDVSVSRARGLLKNIELFGISNAFVTGESPQQLLEQFGTYFDKILVDAPCSGEGMFRKEPSLIKSWMERGPEYYAPLQKEILACGVRMLKPGGKLLYSTCTFSPEEDEQVIREILERFPELEMAECRSYEGFAEGIPDAQGAEQKAENPRFEKEKCIRIWPHRMEGEGHFAVLLKKTDKADKTNKTEEVKMDGLIAVENYQGEKREKTGIGRSGKKQVRSMKKGGQRDSEAVQGIPEEARVFLQSLHFPALEHGLVQRNQEELYLLPSNVPVPKLRYLRTGLHLGTVKRARFEPSQALAMAITREAFSNVLDLSSEHPAVFRYLRGETLDLPEAERCGNGWVLVCCDGYPLGWGKCVNGSIRNKYQAGWRLQ